MKKITIYVPFKSEHNALISLYNNPPNNINFLLNEFKEIEGKNLERKENKNNFRKKIYEVFIRIYEKCISILNLPNIILILPTKKFHYDYILSNGLILGRKQWILIAEFIGTVVSYKHHRLKSPLCLKIIKKFLVSKRCKYIFNWSESSRKTFIDTLQIPENKQHKFKVIYPTLKPINFEKKKKDRFIRLLFVSSINREIKDYNFYMKGGRLVLQAYKRLKPKYKNLKLIFIGLIPPEIKKKYENLPDVEFHLKLSHQDLFELYKLVDIFLFPTYGDSYGFAFLEAMAHELPIICINNHFSAPELVKDNETGFVNKTSLKFLRFPHSRYCPDWIEKRIFYQNLKKEFDIIGLKNFIEKLEKLIQDENLRKKFGKNGRQRLIDGDLSIEYRNRKLYEMFKN